MFLKELSEREPKEYVFREQTVVWKDTNSNDYKLYTSVILETHGWNRFDYAAFNYGDLPENNPNVVVHILQMKEKATYIAENTYILDYDTWNTVYKNYKMKFSNVF
jgi:hypothetical protein